jgi:DNA-binding MarR family transcriptional regulator
VTQGNITQLLDRMEQRGLVARCPEGRSNLLSLTPEGWELYDEVVPAHEEWQAERLSPLTLDEQRQLLSLLDKLERAHRS